MLIYKKANLLLETSGIIIHGCNRLGGFGSGIAGQIRQTYPKVYEGYKNLFYLYDNSKPGMGFVKFVKIRDSLIFGNCITQETFGYQKGVKYASVDAIEKALFTACEWSRDHELQLKSPKIGCGLGGLDWETEVKEVYERVSDAEKMNIEIYEI